MIEGAGVWWTYHGTQSYHITHHDFETTATDHGVLILRTYAGTRRHNQRMPDIIMPEL